MKGKEVQKVALIFVTALVMLFSINFVMSAYYIRTAPTTAANGGVETTFYLAGTTHIINISVNNTDVEAGSNISQVNITMPTGWRLPLNIVTGGAIYNTSLDGKNATPFNWTTTFVNTSSVISWINLTDGLVMYNGSGPTGANRSMVNSTAFWFTLNASTSVNYAGIFTLTVTIFNQSNSSASLHNATQTITLRINDTHTPPNVTATNVTISGVVNPSVITRGNYSGNWIINLSVNDSYGVISHVYYNLTNLSGHTVTLNATGGVSAVAQSGNEVALTFEPTFAGRLAASSFAIYGVNASTGDRHFNFTVPTSTSSGLGVPEGVYNLTVYANDTSGNINNSEKFSMITIDNTAPTTIGNIFFTNVTNNTAAGNGSLYQPSSTNTIVHGGNYSRGQEFNINISVRSTGFANVTQVIFNITNSSGGQNYSVSTIGQTALAFGGVEKAAWNSWNGSLNTSNLADGKYNITVVSIDFAGNRNTTQVINNFIVDSAGPTVTLTKDTVASGKNNLEVDLAVSDTLTAINTTCTSDRPGASITGVTGTQTLTESGLNCGSTYSYVVTCKDSLTNSRSASSASFTTTSCSGGSSGSDGGSSGGGSTSTTSWSATYPISSSDFESGVTKELSSNSRVKVQVNNENHYVGVTKISGERVTVEISSTPVTTELGMEESTKVDVTNDGYYDVYVKLLGIAGGKAQLEIKKIYEKVPVEEEAAADVGAEPRLAPEETGKVGSNKVAWIIAIVVIIIVIIAVWMLYSKKRR